MNIKNLKVGTKLSLGFGFVLFTLVLSILFGYSGLKKINNNFKYYSQITSEDHLAGRIQSILLESRMTFKNYVQFGDDKYSNDFKRHMILMENIINELDNIGEADRSNDIITLSQYIDDYSNGFDTVVEFKKERNKLYNYLSEKGPEIERNLSEYVDNTYVVNDITSQYGAVHGLNNLLVARLHVAKFLVSNEQEEVEETFKRLNDFDKWMEYCLEATTNDKNHEIINNIINDKNEYTIAFENIVEVIMNRNQTINEMDTIGPQITALAGKIQSSITEEQREIEPLIQKSGDDALIRMLAMSLFALIISIIITIIIIRIVVTPVKMVTNTFKEISEGDANFEVRLPVNSEDEIGYMSKYFNQFIVKLEAIITENKKQNWLKTAQAELSEKMKLEQDMNILAESIITYITKYINAQVGAIYIKEEECYRRIAGYAYSQSDSNDNILVKDGIISQVGLEKKAIIVNDIPDDYMKISSGLGYALPKSIIVSPCNVNEEVKCIIELASFAEFTDIQIEFIEHISESIATSIQFVESRVKLKILLDKSMEQAEELQIQQEELRQSNEELEEQAKSLKESEAQLQMQQEELRVVNEELEERTKSLELQKNDIANKNKVLKKAQIDIEEKAQALEIASKYKSEFLANMSHELRTPLNSILVLSEMLVQNKESSLTEKQIKFAKTIHSSGEDLLKLINDILDLSKVEAGKLDVVMEVINIEQLVLAIKNLFSPIAKQKGLYFEVKVDEGIRKNIVSDYQRIHQIIKNLLSNAFKFTEDGGVTLTIRNDENGDGITLSVSDTGIGITKENLELIFEAFKQSDGTTSRKYGGTGLGLSISKELANLLGGKIDVISEAGKGSTFTLYIPNNEFIHMKESIVEKVESDIDSNNEIISLLDKNPDKKDKLLLIIEDDLNFSNILSSLAEEKGYKVLIAENGELGIKLAKEHIPNAIILDIGLPDISGWKVIEQFKDEASTAEIPVHIISGNDINNIDDSLEGIVGYLKKPVSLDSLNNVFKRIEASISKPFKKLLIVDENMEQIKEIKNYFSDKGIKIIIKDTGSEAIKYLKEETVDCMILDIQLKDMTGFKLLEKLKQDHISDLPVLIHTKNDLTQQDEIELRKYAESIVIKGEHSIDRLIAETSLFLHNVDSKLEEKKIKEIKTQQENEETFKNKTILIVDDDMRNVFALSSILEEKGVNVIVGRNGVEGLQKLKQNPDINLILMDIMMPEMDGYTAMRKIRSDDKHSKIPIIALTAKAMKEDKQKCIEAGANDYLTKPLDIDKLTSLLRVWLYK